MRANIVRTSKTTLHLILALCLVISFTPIVSNTAYATDSFSEPESTSKYVSGEILVKFKDDANETTANSTLNTLNAVMSENQSLTSSFEDSSPVVVKLDEGVSVEDAVAQANADPSVAYAQPNYIYTLPANEGTRSNTIYGIVSLSSSNATNELEEYLTRSVPNDPAVKNTTPSSSGAQAWQLANIGAFEAWDIAITDNTVTVVVLDTGCKMDHEDLADRVWTDYAYNAVTGKTLAGDEEGHGTHVCGCVAATANNGLGTAGASYNAKILPIGVFQRSGSGWRCSTSTLITAYEYFMNLMTTNPELNIRVANMSLGGYGEKGKTDIALEQKIAAAKEKGVVTCAAGGNGDDYGKPLTDPIYPSDLENVIAVTALSTNGNSPVSWCDYNSSKDICAPGEYIYSTYYSSTSSYTTWDGTSMATPIVSGCLALMFAANSNLTPDQAEAAIKSTAGAITVESGREGKYGAGRINLAAAVKEVAVSKITEQPTIAAAVNGETASFTIKASSNVTSYQWQNSTNGTTWTNASGSSTSATYSFTMANSFDNLYWRCVVTFNDGTELNSNIVSSQLRGDVNMDKTINIIDAQIALDMANKVYGSDYSALVSALTTQGKSCSYEVVKARADMNKSGAVDALDARAIQAYIHK